MANKTPKDPVAIKFSDKPLDADKGVAPPAFVKVYWDNKPTEIKMGEAVTGFTREQAEFILSDSRVWANNAKLEIVELEVKAASAPANTPASAPAPAPKK